MVTKVLSATTWRARTAVALARGTTWDVTTAAVKALSSTTWKIRQAVGPIRSTTWDTTQAVVPTRTTTWDSTRSVVLTRSTTWDVVAHGHHHPVGHVERAHPGRRADPVDHLGQPGRSHADPEPDDLEDPRPGRHHPVHDVAQRSCFHPHPAHDLASSRARSR